MDECDDQSEVIAFLARPESYGVSGPIERIDTHAAMIFLAGDHAWKLKRAVRYPYLDFSTAARRKAVCEAELALNVRTAPGLYCRVEMVGRDTDGGLALGHGQPVDWLVVMRRFSQDCLFDVMASRHQLAPRLIRDLADGIAAFHACAEPVFGGGAARVRKVIEGNGASMAALAAGLLSQPDCAVLIRRSLAMLDALVPLFDRRAAAGQVRHCHGDLHLANICLWQGHPMLFDCLEFDPELAIGDVLYDIAFLLMDLWQRGLHNEASLLFNRYCDRRDEGDGLAAMPLFLSMRAAVRAHVEASAAGRQRTPAMQQDMLAKARDYLALAIRLLDRPPPRLIAIGGFSGSGKSTLAGHLAPLIGQAPGARWLRTDVLRKRIAGVAAEDRLPAQAYTRQSSMAIYARLEQEAGIALAAGMAVIVDGVFADADARAAMARLAATHSVSFNGLWLEAPHAVLHGRVAGRRGDASDADGAVVDRQLAQPIGDLADWVTVRAAGSPEDVLACALQRIKGDAEHRGRWPSGPAIAP